MPGIAMLILTVFAAALAGMFKRVKNQRTTTGTVISIECKNETGESSKFYAYVEYEVNGSIHVVKSRNKSTSYHVGQKLKIAYNKESPDDAFIKAKTEDYIVVLILFIAAIYMTIQTI